VTTTSERPRSVATLAVLAVLVVAVFAGLVGLGTWQLQRRVWKLDLIARVNQRVHAPPVAPPGPGQWASVTADHDAYRHVRLEGEFLNDRETLVQAVTVDGPGFWVLTPLRTPEGDVVLVNRGFVPPERTAPSSRAAGQIAGPTTVTGLLRVSEPHGGFLRANAPAEGRWYSRDVAAIAAARGVPNVAPYFVDADATPNTGGWPVGGLTVISFPNSHLVYAITWFTLAAMLAGGSIYGVRQTWRQRRMGSEP
jgi:surfeit locus 1 family protein